MLVYSNLYVNEICLRLASLPRPRWIGMPVMIVGRLRFENPASFAVAWFLSSLQKKSRNEVHSGSCKSLLFVTLCILFVDLEHVQLACQLI